jgi:hypothetical protein
LRLEIPELPAHCANGLEDGAPTSLQKLVNAPKLFPTRVFNHWFLLPIKLRTPSPMGTAHPEVNWSRQ